MKPLFLIADDNDGKTDFLQRMILKNMDVEIITAATVEDAISLIDQHVEIACAFVDYYIPKSTGIDIIKHLKKHNPGSLIALVSSADDADNEAEAMKAGAESFICTSWQLDRVETAINLLLAEWKVQVKEN